MDKTSIAVLETLQALIGTSEDVMGGWFYPITIAKALGLEVDVVLDEYDILANADLVDTQVRAAADNSRLGTLARVSKRGAAILAEARKQRRFLESAVSPALEERSNIVIQEHSSSRTYDVFISYASEDVDYARSVRNALAREGVSVWIDVDDIRLGHDILRSIDDGIRQSSHAVLLLSPDYIRKPYPNAEFSSILKRQVDERGNVILPIVHRGLSQEDVRNFSSFLSSLRNIETRDMSLESVVNEILKVVRPPIVTVATPTETGSPSSTDAPKEPGRPFDALDDDVRLFAFRPRINITGFTVMQHAPDDVDLTYDLVNIGNGTASKIRVFLPGLQIDSPPQPIQPQNALKRSLKYSEREAYTMVMPIYAQVVVEFEDTAGNLYRQYGKLHQPTLSNGRYAYEAEELDKPYLVPRRIVEDDPQRRRFKC